MGSTKMKGDLIDQMGRPAINTVFNHADEKNDFNHTNPADQYKPPFSTNVIGAFQALGGHSPHGRHRLRPRAAPGRPHLRHPHQAAGPLNGRGLADDVIDGELGLITNGGILSDCVGAHSDYLSKFPYLGNPHS